MLHSITTDHAQGFARDVQKEVHQYFKDNNLSKKGNHSLRQKTVILLGSFLGIVALVYTAQPESIYLFYFMYVALGVLMAGIGMGVMHDGAHGSYSENPTTNLWMARTIRLLAGYESNWKGQHNVLHHSHTNIVSKDEDLHTGGVLRFHRFAKWLGIHRLQQYYTPFLYSLMTLRWLVWNDFRQLWVYSKKPETKKLYPNVKRAWIDLFFSKILLFIFWIGLPLWLGFSPDRVVGGFIVMHLVAGFILSHIFQPAHIHADVPVLTEKPSADMRMVHQLVTSQNFATQSNFLSSYSGGLNHQIEHHMFPTISHVHYPKISSIVKKNAKKYGLPYREVKYFWKAIHQHYKHLGELGRAT